ncbi:WD40-repeat-containing domain protein [Pyronema domesticum]|uniref:Elongator complex protein 2 n=1 Tax=Pyronema omphalodes (strain CBS 100304) TaxID=1076935 RepID=U4KYX4_PYROM|nr:WD40-repeat-containing domain protein [Pyronema domesticum]CCX07201.1 Similar to Elongator complex protein 2; acc. no. P42935 [Pyronema omphalodes CBS 100304]
MATVENPFVAIGGNRHPQAAEWSPSGTLAFGGGRVIALWNPDDAKLRGVTTTLKGHTDKVNVVRFLPQNDSIILSGSVDKTVRVWRQTEEGYNLAATVDNVHEGSINAIATCPQHPTIFASASADGVVAIHSLEISKDKVEVKHLQSLSTKPKFYPLSLALYALPKSKALILAVAGSTTNISVYIAPSPGADFIHQANLAGHENWVRSLTFTHEDPSSTDSDLILASSSQDLYVRLWRVHQGETLPPVSINRETKTYGFASQLSNKPHMLRLPETSEVWSVTFEALLIGHEDWVYTAAWNPSSKTTAALQLLSCSADNSISVWAPEESSGIWVPVHRFGEISDLKGASTATGSAGGMWNCLWSPDGTAVAALTKNGSWRIWRYNADSDRWLPGIGISGHTKDATGISWSPDGSYLLTTSLDQTTRLFSQWTAREEGSASWHEFSRPQIHGYDINCIASIAGNQFVSGAEEKLLRVFDEPKAIASILSSHCGVTSDSDISALPGAAGLPVLGLSNKPIDVSAPSPMENGHIPEDDDEEAVKQEHDLPTDTPPLENDLSRHTLWPEVEKLYGHGYEISALAASPVKPIIATACKASTLEHAVIRLYDGDNNWREIKPNLESHALTVTNISFSQDGSKILSVGRDRAWSVFAAVEGQWKLVQRQDKAHTRIVYDCAWLPGGKEFVTVSRDKSVKVWTEKEGKWVAGATQKFSGPVTAVDVREMEEGKAWVMVGLEDGGLEVYQVEGEEWSQWTEVKKVDTSMTPDLAVNRICWRPNKEGEAAVASEDGSVRVFRFVV